MATLGKASLAATTLTKICTLGSTARGRRILICNTSASNSNFRLAFVDAGDLEPVANEYVLYDARILAKQTELLNETEVNLSGGSSVWGYSDVAGVIIRVME
jgi:hypothetical protein